MKATIRRKRRRIVVHKGGSGSGNFDHSGRPGKVGGSSSKGRPSKGGPEDKFAWEDAQLNSPALLAKLNVPDKLYHVTERANLESYKKKGIIAKAGITQEFDRGAYLTPDPMDTINTGGGVGDIDLKDPVIIEVSTNKLNLRLDPEYWDGSEPPDFIEAINEGEALYAMYSRTNIPSSAITNVYDPEDFENPLWTVDRGKG